MGQPSSIAKLVLERMDAFLDETDAAGRMPSYSKVAVAAIVGNEDGAHHVSSQIFPGVKRCWMDDSRGSSVLLGRRGDACH